MSRPLSAYVCGKYHMPTMCLYERIALDLISASRKHVVAATGSSPFKVGDNQRLQASGRGRYTQRSLSSRRRTSGRRRYCRNLPAEKERMISGRTFVRETIALRQREAKRAGRILALPGQNPGQLELRTHSEFGVNLSGTPVRFAFLCLRAIPRRGSPAGYHSLRLRPAKTKPQYLLLQPAMPPPGTKDSYTHPTRPLAVPAASSPA